MSSTFRVSAALLLAAAATAACGQSLQLTPASPHLGRTWLDTAYTLGKTQVDVGWDHRQGSKGGRKFGDYATYAAFGVTDDLTVIWDTHSAHAVNRDRTSTFDANGWGLKLKYGIDAWSGEQSRTAVALEWRNADATSVSDGATRTPPDARLWALTAHHTRQLTERSALHLGAGLTDSSVGSGDCRTLQLGGGYDWRFGDDVTLEGTLCVWNDSGDVSATHTGLMGSVAYDGRTGFGVDAGVAFFPNGVPVAGTPLADGTAFSLDPVTISLAQRLRNDALGVLRVGVHYTHQF